MMPFIVPPTQKSRRKDFNLKLSRQLVRAKMGQMVYQPHLDDLVKEALHRKYGIPRPQREVARVVHHLPGRRRKLIIAHTTPAIIVQHIVAGIVQRLRIHVQMRCNACSDDNNCFYSSLHLLYKILFEYMLLPTILLIGWQAYRGDQIHRKNSPT